MIVYPSSITELLDSMATRIVRRTAPLAHAADRPPKDLLSAQDVQREYGIRDLRTARAVIREAGGKRIGGRWLVRRERLEAWEAMPDQADPLAASSKTINHRRDVPLPAASTWRALPPLTRNWLDSTDDRRTR